MSRKTPDKRIIITGILVLSLTVTGNLFARPHKSSYQYTIPQGYDLTELIIEDGIYTGEAIGFNPDVTVEVIVEKGQISEITVIEHNEIGPQYYQRPILFIPAAILDKQETKVDVVSGATATSCAIMSAVENALGLDQE